MPIHCFLLYFRQYFDSVQSRDIALILFCCFHHILPGPRVRGFLFPKQTFSKMPPPSWVPSGENCPVNFLKNSRELRAAEVQEPDGWGSRPTGSPARVSALKSYCWGSNLISKTFFSTRVHPFPVTRSIRPLALTLRCRFLAGWSNFAFDKRNT